MVRDFKKLEIWKEARALNKEIYLLTKKFPSDEKFGLTSQLRRATVSVSSNIAEGCGRRTNKDFAHLLYNALGSLKEVESQLFLALDLEYISDGDFKKVSFRVSGLGRKILSFIDYIERGESR